MSAAGLDARLLVEREGFTLDLELAVAPGAVLAVLGPNGAGKSTALRAIAGLVGPTGGHVRVAGRVLDDVGASVRVPTEKRGLGVVFQDYLLFPHLSVRDNVAFGLRAQGVARAEAHERSERWLERMALGPFAEKRPAALSGGQAQRVALARALVLEPRLLLLDEPLAALDASTRMDVRAELAEYLGDFPGSTVLVTHDPLDAMVLASEVLVVEHGRVTQRGAPAQLARAPRTDYVARLMGLNLVTGRAQPDDAGVAVRHGGGILVRSAETSEGPVTALVFAPSAVGVHRSRPEGSPRNVWECRVRGVEQHAQTIRVRATTAEGGLELFADITAAALAELRLAVGDTVWLSVKAGEVRVSR
ncbi:ABC transporter ATP-binding protein [Compostimonas suwonensis]|uniref:Molybdate transport system ATP-binding protein n=1 Tax=Compostimonas suwonensis TaxID=1048394 RepID=A0A2M9BU10_9MICO|nr:ABC transporter ATP-binding protein [Compostimonas suwonensis]PJJ61434.1 molybdate transport system ATP-binding protein [Compostimonas suwonensis]